MHAGRVACCLIVIHVEYAPRALLTLRNKTGHSIYVRKKMGQTDRRTDGRTPDRRYIIVYYYARRQHIQKLYIHSIKKHNHETKTSTKTYRI